MIDFNLTLGIALAALVVLGYLAIAIRIIKEYELDVP